MSRNESIGGFVVCLDWDKVFFQMFSFSGSFEDDLSHFGLQGNPLFDTVKYSNITCHQTRSPHRGGNHLVIDKPF